MNSAARLHEMFATTVEKQPENVEPGPSYVPAYCSAPRALIFQPFGPRMQVSVILRAGDRVYKLRGPLVINIEYLEDGTVFATHRDLPVHGYGETLNEALESFGAGFDLQYRSLVDEPDPAQLTPHALELGRKLRAFVGSILTV